LKALIKEPLLDFLLIGVVLAVYALCGIGGYSGFLVDRTGKWALSSILVRIPASAIARQ
jgi:hypothetical protein